MSEATEAEELSRLFEGRTVELVSYLAGQLSVLKGQAQTYLGIAGLCISVTGFAGHNIVNAGLAAAGCMVAGIVLILVAIAIALRALGGIRWVSQDLGVAPRDLALRVIERRNLQQRSLGLAGALIGAGLTAYLVAVVMAAVTKGHWTPP
ncbi:MAG: hypothetical protein R3B13_14910 [Polyangiaceae bacterium]